MARFALPLLLGLGLACGGAESNESVAPVAVSSSGDEALVTEDPSPPPLPPPPDVDVPQDITRYRVPVEETQPQRGASDAAVTIVMFGDYQCPFCRRASATLEELFEHYGERQLRLVWRNRPLPFHQQARPAAVAAMEAFEQGGPEMFWRLHEMLYDNQEHLERPDLERYFAQLGLDVAELARALDGDEHADLLAADDALAMRIGARGTPNFFINGRQLTGAQPTERFRTIIDQELVVASQLRDRGIPTSATYLTLTLNARTEAEAPEPSPAPTRRRPDPDAVYRVPVAGNLPQWGPDDALVTIVSFSDFQCPFCQRVLPTLEQVQQRYGQDVRLVWMNNPLAFHQRAFPAAMAALEAFAQQGDRAFWGMHDRLFANQRQLEDADLQRYATELGLDAQELQRAVDGDRYRSVVEAQQRLARSLGASGTPSFFINGRNLRGAQPFAAFESLIDEELAKARRLVAAGTPRSDVYARTTANGHDTAQFIAGAAAAPSAPPPPDRQYAIPVPRRAPRRGARRAPVVIQIFSDFQCPFCNRVQPTLDTILQEYGNRVQLVWRDYPLPFHQNAHLAAEAAREVFRQGNDRAFWRFHDLLFANQRALEKDDLLAYARQVRGVNVRRLERALDRRTHEGAVDRDMEAVRDAGARIGTPSFFINGRLLQGAQPAEAFRQAIDRALQEANSP